MLPPVISVEVPDAISTFAEAATEDCCEPAVKCTMPEPSSD